MKTHTIYIGFVDSLIGYWDQDKQKAHKKHARRQDRIGWESLGSEEFRLEFSNGSPFEGGQQVLVSAGGVIAPRKVDARAEARSYAYTVTALSSVGEADPEIVIDPDGDSG